MSFDGVHQKPVIYQLAVRLFSNTNETIVPDGTLAQNGVGKFADIDAVAIRAIRDLGATHIWLLGVLRQATLTDYAAYGMPADDPDVVKGRAGSYYAVRDCYDVCPDYATRPDARMREFEALVGRIHQGGLQVLIDLVPNHVARGYGSVVHPERDFGLGDDQSVFFARDNSFFYLVDPPGRRLALSKPADWNPAGVVFDGAFGPEDGGPGRVPKATGNNVTSTSPSATDWYETIKLNYGYQFVDPPASSYSPVPATWEKVDAILRYWQDKGVDGFRVDFAHWVPVEAWRWLLERVKSRGPRSFVMAEAYENLPGLLEAGFDAVYHDEAYDLLKSIYLGRASEDDLAALLGSLDDSSRGRYVQYLENHDERRIASPIVPGDPGGTGFGAARAGRQLAPLLLLYSQGPVLVHNGQEVGERGAGASGFSGEDGRTTIFDYGSMPVLARWVNGHAYDGGRLSAEERDLRSYYRDVLALAQSPEVRGHRYWGLRYLNRELFSFARYARGAGSLLVVVTNFAVGSQAVGQIRIPEALAEGAGLAPDERLKITLVLSGRGAVNEDVAHLDLRALASDGFVATLSDQTSHAYRISRDA